MTTATALLNAARGELGYIEGANNHTKYGVAYGLDHVPWCAQFVWWCARQASGGDKLIAPIAYTPAMARWFGELGAAGRLGSTPRRGAVAFFDFPDSIHRIQHVGFVEKVLTGGRIQTIEGNTSPGTGGSQADGGGVHRRIRSTGLVVAYGYPLYTPEAAARPLPPSRDTTRHLTPLVVDGVAGRLTIAQTQRFLRVPVTGRWDGTTRRALQRWLGVRQDGVIGRVTTRAWRRKVAAPAGTGIDSALVRAHQRYLNRNL